MISYIFTFEAPTEIEAVCACPYCPNGKFNAPNNPNYKVTRMHVKTPGQYNVSITKMLPRRDYHVYYDKDWDYNL